MESDETSVTELSDGICPLCSQVFPIPELHTHIGSEHPRSKRNSIIVIQAYHKGWVEAHGACEACWKSFRDAGRIMDLLKQSQPQTPRAGVR